MRLCLTLAESDPRRLQLQMKQFCADCSVIEVRLDYLDEPAVPKLPAQSEAQWIATCRPPREGGRFRGEEAQRRSLLKKAAGAGFDYLDLEHDIPALAGLPGTVRIIRSRHLFDQFPAQLSAALPRVDHSQDVAKLAVTCHNTDQAVRLLRWMESDSSRPRVILGMGPFGQMTRYLGPFLGNEWTYVSSSPGGVAPGQFSLDQGLECFANWRDQSTPIYGVLGNPVHHSLSPALHNFLFRRYRKQGIYLPLLVDSLASFRHFVNQSSLRFQGFSVTMPHKMAAVEWLGSSSPSASPINTLTRTSHGWQGINTDLEGFLQPLKQRISLPGCRVVVLGTGGVAHTVVAALAGAHAEPIVVGRSLEALSGFSSRYGCETALWSERPVKGQVMVNATPVGQYPDQDHSPWDGYALDFDLVYDLIYRPQVTSLLKAAEQSGAQVISGMEMFVKQAALQFLKWTSTAPDLRLMQTFLGRRLQKEGIPT